MTTEARLRDPIAEARRQWMASGWEDAAPGMAAVTTIARVHQIVLSLIEQRLSPLGLTFARFEILRLLGFARDGRLPMGKIGQRLQVHPASVTSAVKRLERDGKIRREVSDLDNRVVLAVLTPTGREVLDSATEEVNQVFETLPLSESQLEDLVTLLNPIRAFTGDEVIVEAHHNKH